MATIQINNCEYYYEIHGDGPETLVLSHGLLWSSKMFHKQIDYFKSKYRIICYDHRGQGRSEVTKTGYSMDQLTHDAALLVEKLCDSPVHFGGLSMGGFVGLRLAARKPNLLKSLILMETTALPEPNTIKYNVLNTIVKLFGIKMVVKPVMKIMFGQKFLNDPDRKSELHEWQAELLSNKKTIVRAVEGVIGRKGVESELGQISCPCLIMVGTQDIATTPEKAEFMHSNIQNSQLIYIQGGGHTSCIEEPDQYNHAIEQFLENLSR